MREKQVNESDGMVHCFSGERDCIGKAHYPVDKSGAVVGLDPLNLLPVHIVIPHTPLISMTGDFPD